MNDDETLAVAGHFPNNPHQQNEPKPSGAIPKTRCTYVRLKTHDTCRNLCPPGMVHCGYHAMKMQTE